jgi:hypothetical protein
LAKGLTTGDKHGGKPPKYLDLPNYGVMVAPRNRHRYETLEVWRSDDMFSDTWDMTWRPEMPGIEAFDSAAHFAKVPLIADYADGADKIFLMIKEGSSVIWERLPVHLWTTLTRVKHFALYSDAPGSIGGHEIIDILDQTAQSPLAKDSDEFDLYRKQREVHDNRQMVEYNQVTGKKGGWELDRFKNLPMLEHAYKVAPPEVEWFVFMDGDSYVVFDNLAKELNTLNSSEYHYFGNDAGGFAHGGSGVVISRGAMDATYGLPNSTIPDAFLAKTFEDCCGDSMVAQMLGVLLNIGVRQAAGFQGDTYWDIEMKKDWWCDPLVTLHHISAREIEVFWEYERVKRLQGRNMTFSEVYKDFYLPFMTANKENWDNRAEQSTVSEQHDRDNGIMPSDKGGHEVRPYENVQACRKHCESDSECLSFRLRREPRECQTASYFRFGHATRTWIKKTHSAPDMVSGWMIDRIRDIRARSSCDEASEFINDRDRVEGWYYRNSRGSSH